MCSCVKMSRDRGTGESGVSMKLVSVATVSDSVVLVSKWGLYGALKLVLVVVPA